MKYNKILCWVLPHEKTKIENLAKAHNNINIIFIDSFDELRNSIDNSSLVYISTTRATKYSNKEEIIAILNNYPQVQFCMGEYDCNYDPLENDVFLEPLANNFINVYPRMLMTYTAIEVFISGEFPDPWADVSPYYQ